MYLLLFVNLSPAIFIIDVLLSVCHRVTAPVSLHSPSLLFSLFMLALCALLYCPILALVPLSVPYISSPLSLFASLISRFFSYYVSCHQSQQHLLIFFRLMCFSLSLIEMMRCQQRRYSPWILMVVVLPLLLLGLPWGML